MIVKLIFLKELGYFGIIPPTKNPLTLKSAFLRSYPLTSVKLFYDKKRFLVFLKNVTAQ